MGYLTRIHHAQQENILRAFFRIKYADVKNNAYKPQKILSVIKKSLILLQVYPLVTAQD